MGLRGHSPVHPFGSEPLGRNKTVRVRGGERWVSAHAEASWGPDGLAGLYGAGFLAGQGGIPGGGPRRVPGELSHQLTQRP